MLALATDIAAIDHHDGSVWLIANAVNADAQASGIDGAYDDAVARVDAMQAALASAPNGDVSVMAGGEEPAVRMRSAEGEFEEAVRFAKEAIRDGDVFPDGAFAAVRCAV